MKRATACGACTPCRSRARRAEVADLELGQPALCRESVPLGGRHRTAPPRLSAAGRQTDDPSRKWPVRLAVFRLGDEEEKCFAGWQLASATAWMRELAGPATALARGTSSERVVDRSAHACFPRAKHERDLGSARRLVVVRSASDVVAGETRARTKRKRARALSRGLRRASASPFARAGKP
jgi:hypothetical protein